MGIAQWRDSCGDRPHTDQPEPHDGKEHLLSATKEKRSRLRRLRTRRHLVLRGLQVCAECASKPRLINLDRISKTTKELLGRRRALRLDPNASHIERQKKILESAQRRTSLKKCCRDLREYNISLAALLSEDGTRTSSRREMEIITESPIIPTGEAPPRISPSEIRVALKSMEPGTAPGPDFISADFLRAERKDPKPVKDIANGSYPQERTLDEAQPQEQAGFRQGFSCLDHIQTVSKVIEVCREYRLPFVLTFFDYEKAFDSVETNAILSALVDHGVDASYVRTLANLTIDARLGYSFSTAVSPNRLERGREEIGLRIKRKKTQLIKNAHCEDGGVQLEGFQIVETSSYVYLGRSMNMENDLKEELNRRMRAPWAAFAAVREATDQLTDQDLRAHLFDSTVLPALCYAARRGQIPLPRLGSYLLPTEPLRDAF
ncbi:hypothetical protein RB195_022051 [Necator americanus]|uniref:Reverse transcriptase domain-containing protein n=1 Tax=Necator americanus TaxID=51031 RepID=A0ABR1EDR6_NECAM